MPVPDFQSLMLPCIMALKDGKKVPIAELRNRVAASEGLTADDRQEMLPSGGQSVFANRVGWALTHMAHAGLLERTTRGEYCLTRDGEHVLSQTPSRIDVKMLREFPRYAEWRTPSSPSDTTIAPRATIDSSESLEESIESATRQLRGALEAEVLERVRDASPPFFEQVVMDLLIKLGYGGGDAANGHVTMRLAEGGIYGKIREDALGLDEVYVEARTCGEQDTVRGIDLRNFAGALDAEGTTKGVLVTTGSYTRDATEYVRQSPKRIALIDGQELARLMVRHGIGVRTRERYDVKQIDEAYFDHESM